MLFLPIFNNPNPLGIIDFTGIILWLIAFTGEASADKQLRDFKKLPENKFKVCRVGFWDYSRHPNYFFEWLQWIAYVFLSIGSNEFYLSLIGPIFMYFFLIKVSGVHWVELQAVKKRGEVDRFEEEEVSFFEKIRQFYLETAKKNSKRFFVIDASQSMDEVFNIARDKIINTLNES